MNYKYMEIALKEAKKAYKKGEVPVGAVIVKNNKIISKSHNTIEKYNNVLKHAEMNVINKATKKLKNWRLTDCDLYVTLEPCRMCKGAIFQARIKKVYYATQSNTDKNYDVFAKIESEKYEQEASYLLQSFFKNKRK